MKSAIPDVMFGCLIFFITTWVVSAIAPDDHNSICRTSFRHRAAHDWIPYANDSSSGTWKILLDQYDYQNLLGGTLGGVWSAEQFSPDSDGLQFVEGSGGTCNHQLRLPNTFENSDSNNWVFTQAVDYLDAVELIVNATVRFSGCTQRPDCANDFVILHRYDTNSLSENQRTNPDNYQPYLGDQVNSRLQQDPAGGDTTIITRFNRSLDFKFKYTYFGIQDIGTTGNVIRIIVYYVVCPGRVEGLVTYPEVPHPVQGSSQPTIRNAQCAEHAHSTTSLATFAYNDGRCVQDVHCDCDAGYEEVRINSTYSSCIACRVGTYKATGIGRCTPCPANSTAVNESSVVCECDCGTTRDPSRPGDPCRIPVPAGPISVAGAVAMTFFFTLIPTAIITALTVILVMWYLCIKDNRSVNNRHKNGHSHATSEPDEKDVCHVNVAYNSKSANITDSVNRRPAPTSPPKYQPKKPPPPPRPTAPSRPY